MIKHKQKNFRKAVNSNSPLSFPCPSISVIIPMYNAERYIGDCLDSILAQTFQSFEVIVVDDCSTDSSCAVVENYTERFDGRLTLMHMEENSGCAPFPRNRGLVFSRGEYIYFMDADDLLTKTALEEMHTLAKDYDADVVYCEKFFETDADGTNARLVSKQSGTLVDKPTFETEEIGERVKDILRRDIWGTPWTKLVRRDLLTKHELTFMKVRPCDDYLWTLGLYFFAKKFLRVPNALYLWRQTETSATRGNRSPQREINLWLESAVLGLKGLDKILGKSEFFRNNVQYRHAILDFVVKKMFGLAFPASLNVSPVAFYEAVRQGFGKDLGEQDVLVAALCSYVNDLMKTNIKNSQLFNQFAAQAKARIAYLEAELQKRQT